MGGKGIVMYKGDVQIMIERHVEMAAQGSKPLIMQYMRGLSTHEETEKELTERFNGESLSLIMDFNRHRDLFENIDQKKKAFETAEKQLLEAYCLRKEEDKIVFDESVFNSSRGEAMSNLITTLSHASVKKTDEDIVEKYVAMFDSFHLREWCKDELRGYFRYLSQNKVRDIQYNFLIQAEPEDSAYDFINKLIEVIGRISSKNVIPKSMTESNLLANPPKEEIERNNILIVSRCMKNSDYYATDGDTSDIKRKKDEYDYHWDLIMDAFEQYPDKVFIMYTTPDIIHDRIKSNPRMFYRFFSHHIIIGNMNEEEIYNSILNKLATVTNKHSVDFEYKLKEYIDTVYPKADLKNNAFVDDLYKRMVSLAFQKSGHCDYFSESSIPFYHRNESFDSIDREFRKLIGLDEVKETFRDIGRLCQNLPTDGDKPYLHMVFKGNPGTGKTTVAKYVAKLLSSMRVIKRNHVETVMTGDLLGQYVGQTAPKVERMLKRAEGGVLVIDEAYLLNPESSGIWTDTYREECIGVLIKAMEKKTDPVIVFAGYPKQMDELMKSNPGLSSRIGYSVNFEDYSNDQLLDIFKSMCEKADYDYDDEAIDAVNRKISALRYEENFGNARTVENIFNQAAVECLREDSESRSIKAEHIIVGRKAKTIDELQRELDNLIGIENAKRVLQEQILSNRFSREKEKTLPTSNNMIFVGNAGTGKTTTAKLFAEMLFSIGAAKSPRTKMITAKDLYVSDVAGKLNEICNETMGGVLFIDEIYLLNRFPSVCTEVVSVLLELLENKKEDITVILAGYEKQTDEFLNENQGLKSRFPITVHFDDFTEEELCEIFTNNCDEDEMIVSAEAMSRFREIIRKEMKKENFGNGRSVRNIYEQAFRRHAVNYYNDKIQDPDLLTEDDLEMPVEVNENRVKIGFTH